MRGPERRVSHMWIVPVVLLGVPAVLLAAFVYWATHFPPFGGFGPDRLPDPPPPNLYGTPAEVGTRGDDPNPGVRFAGEGPAGEDTQERGPGQPARLSGYTTWVEAIDRIPAPLLVDGYTGYFVRVRVRIFNRDEATQAAGATDFTVWHGTVGTRAADAVGAPPGDAYLTDRALPGHIDIRSGRELRGDVFFYVGDTTDGLYLRYHPVEDLDQADAVWSLAEFSV